MNNYVNYNTDPFAELDLIPNKNLISDFKVPNSKNETPLFFDPDDVNPFEEKKTYNKSLLDGLYEAASEKKKSSSSDLKNSPFYVGNNLPRKKDSDSESSSESVEGNYTRVSGTEASKKITNFLLDKGLSKHAVAGIVGNLYAESKFDTSVLGDGKTSGGIAQWHADRFANLKQFASQNGKDWRDLDLQLNFLWYELTTKYSSVLNKLQKANSAEKAAEIWGHDYEVFSGHENFNHERYKDRRNYAKQFYKILS